jgi:uroporphyrinogen decarboxylase
MLRNPDHPMLHAIRHTKQVVSDTLGLYDTPGRSRVWQPEKEGAIATQGDFAAFPWVTPDDFDYSPFEDASKRLVPGTKIAAMLGYIFVAVWQLMGFERFCMGLVQDPDLVQKLFEKAGGIQIGVLERMLQFDSVGVVIHSDDIAYSEALMISPQHLRQYFFPWLKRVAEVCHAHDVPLIYHSDGKLDEVLDDLVECGVDGLHPIEPKAMDIVQLKQDYGGRLALLGNVDLSYTLTRGTPEEVAAEVIHLLHTVAPGGGYCLGSGNCIPAYVPFENYQALRQTCIDYGDYPISLD